MPAEKKNGWSEKFSRQLDLAKAHLDEHGLEVFLELLQKNPEKAVQEIPQHIKRILNQGGGIFKGRNAGGPYPPAIVPVYNFVGSIYHLLNRDLRERALEGCVDFLHKQNTNIIPEYLEGIHEPWLVADLHINTILSWPGFKQYSDRLQPMTSWQEFEKEFIRTEPNGFSLKAQSRFWLAYTVSRVEYCAPEIRRTFSEIFPELTDRTKDAIAAIIFDHSMDREAKKQIPSYQQGVENSLKKYDPSWESDLQQKLEEEKWIWLPVRIREIEYARKNFAKE